MPTNSQATQAMANVGYNVLQTVGRAFGAFAFGVNPVSLGASIGAAIGGAAGGSPWRHHDRTVVHQN
jgi:hypothetical protein